MSDDVKWEWIGWREYAAVEQMTGRILGRVQGGGGVWTARTETLPLGQYLERDRAQRAVERALFLAVPPTEEA